MATNLNTLEYIVEQLGGSENIIAKKMFGEYCLYMKDKVIGLVCDNTLFLKNTEAGRVFAPDLKLAPPYPSAKDALKVGAEIEDHAWLAELLAITWQALPNAKIKKKSVKKAAKSKARKQI